MKTLFQKIIFSALLVTASLSSNAVEFVVFGDAKYSADDTPDSHAAFSLGALDFYATSQLDDKTRAFVEYAFEDPGEGLITDLERLWVARDINESMTVAMGRFHTPLGSYNRVYHHGAYMQDSISRPFFLDFEDGAAGVLPVHVIGLMTWGTVPFSWGSMSYEAYVSNGSSIDTDEFGFNASSDGKPEMDINVSGDSNDSKSIGARMTFAPESSAIKTSFFFAKGIVGESGTGIETGVVTGGDLVEQLITGFDINAQWGSVDLVAEYYNIDNDSFVGDQQAHTGSAYYVQLGIKSSATFKWVFRHEDLTFDAEDSYFQLLGATEATHDVFGFRYDLSEISALKMELNRASFSNGDEDEKSFTIEWSFMLM